MEGVRGIICFLGIGSNMNDPAFQCMKAIEAISKTNGIKLLRVSSLYRTEPVGVSGNDWFVNAVAEIRTMLKPRELFMSMMDLEKNMGRVRAQKWEQRIIDIDILLYGQEIIRDEEITIPHHELHRRRFVLVPMCEIGSHVIHPSFGISMKGLLERLNDTHTVEKIDREA